MTLVGLDLGTTYCKAGLYELDGRPIHLASRWMFPRYDAAEDYTYFDPDALWNTVTDLIREVVSVRLGSIQALGITSMAETGLLIDRETGEARSPMLPWFDRSAQPQADKLAATGNAQDFYLKTGLHMNYKCSVAKIRWLCDQDETITDGAIWLSASDYIAYRLTGQFATDYSLAGRTGGFDLMQKTWSPALLTPCGLKPELFPDALPSGTPIGGTQARWTALGLAEGTPVAVSGHDHLCAAFVMAMAQPGVVFDSMGTAEVLTGSFPERTLTPADYRTGLLSGCHVTPKQGYWLGSLSLSGGSVEWLRGIMGDVRYSYDDLSALVNLIDAEPTGILFFPYLSGSGAPHTDPKARGAWVGLNVEHTRAHLARAVLEGTAYEMEWIRRAGEEMTGTSISRLTAAGGGTRNDAWLQIKADVSGCSIAVCDEADLTLMGAALAAGIGTGVTTVDALVFPESHQMIEPDEARHKRYRALFEQGYQPLQIPLRQFSRIEALNNDKQG